MTSERHSPPFWQAACHHVCSIQDHGRTAVILIRQSSECMRVRSVYCWQVKDGNYEGIYAGMPPLGLGRFTELVPCEGMRATAAGRLAAKSQKGHAEIPPARKGSDDVVGDIRVAGD